jgi:hypothetical protein
VRCGRCLLWQRMNAEAAEDEAYLDVSEEVEGIGYGMLRAKELKELLRERGKSCLQTATNHLLILLRLTSISSIHNTFDPSPPPPPKHTRTHGTHARTHAHTHAHHLSQPFDLCAVCFVLDVLQ